MALIKHNTLNNALASLTGEGGPPAFLICGEPFLVRQAFDTLTAAQLKGLPKEFALESLDGRTTPVGDIIEQVSTFSFIQSKKVIAVKDAPLFTAKAGPSEISYSKRDMDLLGDLVEKGIPENHILVMTSTAPDKRKKIYKLLQEHGAVIDCTVAQGARKADLEEQRSVLRDLARQLLSGTNKQMDQAGFNALVDQTGFNPDLFAGNIEKLLAYTGTRPKISVQDIMAVVHRDKKDPIFSLTNAIMDRDGAKAMTLLASLFSEGFHPLQILKSLENQVRKLLNIKCFVAGLYQEAQGLPPLRTMHFNGFKQVMMPKITAYDTAVAAADEERDRRLAPSDDAKGGKKKKKTANDLLLAPNPKNPYPVFQNFQKSENFSLDELTAALMALSDLDFSLKSSGADAKTGIENFIMTLCRKGGFRENA
ncbi:MAG: DNA polymerase III subunit delta [Desulfobacterales bacterium]|nr:DNA polymerase III subunit delta [Desulfobacterales bacterium]